MACAIICFTSRAYKPLESPRMAELKTRPTGASVAKFLNSIEDEGRRKDCKAITAIMQKATRSKPKMWGPAIVGFGDYHYKSGSGREGDWFQAGFSPRKQALTLYLMGGYPKDADTAKKLGKFKTGGSCLYIKRLDDVHLPTLRSLIAQSLKRIRAARIDYSK
jgi:hypothetical protein